MEPFSKDRKTYSSYPKITEDGRTVWACCEMTHGPVCQHISNSPARITTADDAKFADAALFEWADKGLRRQALSGVNREAAELYLALEDWRARQASDR